MTDPDNPRPLRLLIADDSSTDRLILQAILRRQGHEVQAAEDGQAALQLYHRWQPDMVLLDVMMPRMDGMEAARQIKALAGETLVPVIFLTSLSDAGSLAQCLEAGGDDFLPKPYNPVIIRAKLWAFDRMRRMQETLARQRDLIHMRNQQLLDEQVTARRVFDNIAHTGCLDAPNIRYHASPMSVFNGDILFACPRPAGGMHLLVGDFTGHGLPAAIGALPVAEIFYGMTSKGFSGPDVLRELNQKLVRILPTGMFCCATFAEVDFRQGVVRVWNGGLPDGYLMDIDGTCHSLVSRHLPLGVLGPERFAAPMEEYRAKPGDQLLLMTDGVLEATDAGGQHFGEQRLLQALATQPAHVSPVDHVIEQVQTFAGGGRESDDLTLLGLRMTSQDPVTKRSVPATQSALTGPAFWRCSYEVEGPTLGQFNPLPLLLHVCMAVAGLRQHSGEIYTLLAELYNNALEHGVLELPSAWKNSPEGFARYYAERERRLAVVEGHSIQFDLEHCLRDSGGRLIIRCRDSGQGFDPEAVTEPGERAYAGRGLALIRRLSSGLTYNKQGNQAEVVYDWELTEHGSGQT
ncbi:Histidine kinase-like ATPase domain-containing protein [Marinobacter segnicrescens]|uniref:Histidine kinase-like ATPase domain-containing protein n=1 Tax=Marinobacter segnicrescens TaxID=430453 RepID=A0A1H9Z4H9_9GAMM|nr:fused response regulator/phosphatase [Marinobacter segnicrescens]SES76408.1 Histidine kinase-like ATPase domain-containing protein [Marinobacter segnicrescens]